MSLPRENSKRKSCSDPVMPENDKKQKNSERRASLRKRSLSIGRNEEREALLRKMKEMKAQVKDTVTNLLPPEKAGTSKAAASVATLPRTTDWSEPDPTEKENEVVVEMEVTGGSDGLLQELNNIAQLAKGGNKLDVDKAIGIVAEAVKRNLKMSEQINHLNAKVQKLAENNAVLAQTNESIIADNINLKTRIEYLERAIIMPEINVAKRGVIIRGLPEGENAEDDKATIKKLLLEELKLDTTTIESANRVPVSRIAAEKAMKQGKKAHRPMIVRFTTVNNKYTLFKSLSKLKGKEEYNDVKVANDIPLSLRDRNNYLEGKAKRMRAADKKLRTRVIFDRETIILQIRGGEMNEEEWRRIE